MRTLTQPPLSKRCGNNNRSQLFVNKNNSHLCLSLVLKLKLGFGGASMIADTKNHSALK